MIRVSGLLIEDMRTAVCIRFCVAAKEGGSGGSAGKRDGREEEQEQARERAAKRYATKPGARREHARVISMTAGHAKGSKRRARVESGERTSV